METILPKKTISKKALPFRGVATALITPFTENAAAIDLPAFDALVQRQTEAGISALVVAGTTGEAAALTDREHALLLTRAKERAPHTPIIAGCGAPTTERVVHMVREAAANGADGVLIVTPYYNKCTQEGLYRHYMTAADAADIPVILYEVPSRTGMKVDADTYARLSAHDNIVALKDATGDLERAALLCGRLGDTLSLYAGNDGVTVPLLSVGGQGVISVLSNLAPRTVLGMYNAWAQGDTASAAAIQQAVAPAVAALFSHVNPIPVKEVAAALGMCHRSFRLPLCPLSEEARRSLCDTLVPLCE